MKMHNQPTKESIREWLQRRQTERQPPPSIERIRRQLGWNLAAVITVKERRVSQHARDRSARIAT
jgi:hypothetical protein